MLIRINDIEIGDRYRHDMGDVDALAQSIADVGLLHPIVVTPNNVLIAGRRRLEAYKLLGLVDIPVTVVDLQEIAQGEFAENEMRKDFTWSERCAIADALEPGERDAAKERQRSHSESGYEKFTDPAPTLDKVAHAVGTSRPTLEKAREIVDSGDEELIREMDKAGNVSGVYRKLKRSQLPEPPPPLPDGKYHIILADPPWLYDYSISDSRKIENQYPTMELQDIMDLPIENILAADCVLFLWATSPKLVEAMQVITSWGFTYKTSMVWVKDKIGMGYYARQQHELLLISTRGTLPVPLPQNRVSSVIEAPRVQHSRKPEKLYNIIEKMYPDRAKIELFSRGQRAGWDMWGNQC